MRTRACSVVIALAALVAPLMTHHWVGAKARATDRPIRVLVYSITIGHRHISVDYSKEVLAHLLALGNYKATFTEDPAMLNPAVLAKTDVVVWDSTSGNENPFKSAQRAAYGAWIRCGGGHVGMHASTDSYKDWPDWAELTGTFLSSHNLTPGASADDTFPQYEGSGETEANLLILDHKNPAMKPWANMDSFNLADEYYNWQGDPSKKLKNFRALIGFGSFTNPVYQAAFGHPVKQPLAWTGSFRGLNRVFYTNLGHSVTTWKRFDYQQHIMGGIGWVAGKRPNQACLKAAGITA